MPCEKLLDYLESNGVDFEFIEHPKAYAAEDVAHKAGVPERAFAKTVMVKLDGLMAMAVIPAIAKVNFNLLREAAGRRPSTSLSSGSSRRASRTANWERCRHSATSTG